MLERYEDHFLVALEHLFDWDDLKSGLVQLYRGRGKRGRPPDDPKVMIKMLFLSYFYDVSGRQIEELADQNLLLKWFLDLAMAEAPPDHSTLSFFCQRLHRTGSLERVFDRLIEQARDQGVAFGSLQILDSVHTQADVNNAKDRDRQKKGSAPRDPDARVVNKGKRQVVQPNGKKKRQEQLYFGYKSHCSVDAATGVVTSVLPARGNTADNKAFPALREHDRKLGLPTESYCGDRAYDDTDIHERLEAEGLHCYMKLRSFRIEKKDANKGRWLELIADSDYEEAQDECYKVERTFGWAKSRHGLERRRYLGLDRYHIQSLLTFMVTNAKRLVKLLTGITFRPQAKGRRAERLVPVYSALPWV